MPQAAALVFAATIAVVVAFQLALALGAPWGAYAMGGTVAGRFPPPLRVLAVVQAVLLGGLALIVLGRAGIGVTGLPAFLVWLPVGISLLAVLLNAASRSSRERRLWVPVAVVLLVSSLVVALTAA
jgi:hypothetical protein